MDIEEERPSDSSTCGSPFKVKWWFLLFLIKTRNFELILNIVKADHKPCRPGENQICEWDYLRIIAGTRSSRKMCQYVNRFRKFAVQAGIPGTPDYSYFFTDYSYQSDPMFYNVVRDGWFKAWYKKSSKNLHMRKFLNFSTFFYFFTEIKGKTPSIKPSDGSV